MIMSKTIRKFVLMLALVFALGAAPSAFARHSYSISVGGPGYGISYSNCNHCRGGSWGGYVGGGWYSPGYYSSYYAPAYYGGPYYGGPYYDSYPSYSSYYYYDRPVHRTYRTYRTHHRDYDDGYYGDHHDRHDRRDRDDDHYRDRYYDRDHRYGH